MTRPTSRPLAVLREAIATAFAQPVSTIVTIVIVAAMCLSVLLTTGRTVGSERSVLSTFDAAGTRTIIIRGDAGAGLNSSVLDRLSNIDGISLAVALAPPTDVENVAIPGSTKVPMRLAWISNPELVGLPAIEAVPGRSAWGSATALSQLGLPDSSGGITTSAGMDLAVVGKVDTPDYLKPFEPLLIAPQPSSMPGDISVLVVIAARPDLIQPVSTAVQSVLAPTDASKVSVTTSAGLAQLRALVQGHLGTFGRSLVLVIFAVTAVLVATILYGLVMLRRKDFGRRRALGATRRLIVGLLLTQMALTGAAGSVLGCIAAVVSLLWSGDPLPGADFIVGVGVLATAVCVVAAVIPAIAASRRDPIHELRVP